MLKDRLFIQQGEQIARPVFRSDKVVEKSLFNKKNILTWLSKCR